VKATETDYMLSPSFRGLGEVSFCGETAREKSATPSEVRLLVTMGRWVGRLSSDFGPLGPHRCLLGL